PCEARVIIALKPQPPAVGESKETAQPQIRIRRDATLARDDVTDALSRNIDLLGQPIVAETHRLQELIAQHLAGRRRCDSLAAGDRYGAKVRLRQILNSNAHRLPSSHS